MANSQQFNDSLLDFLEKKRIGVIPESVRTERLSGSDLWDIAKPTVYGLPVLAAGYAAGGVIGFSVSLAVLSGYHLFATKRDLTGWMFEPIKSKAEKLREEDAEIAQLFTKEDDKGKAEWWGQALQDALTSSNIPATVVAFDNSGASVDMYELEVKRGFDINALSKLGGNFARDVGLPSGVKFDVIPNIGNGRAGLYLPKTVQGSVPLRAMLKLAEKSKAKIPVIIGLDINGKPSIPCHVSGKHNLIGGETGGGKSIEIANIIAGIAWTRSPEQVRLTLIDPKQVELSIFDGLPHLYGKKQQAIGDMRSAIRRLMAINKQMDARYALMRRHKCRNIESLNTVIDEQVPYHVAVIEEVTDIITMPEEMTIKGKKTTIGKLAAHLITRLARLGRAAGILLDLGAQRFDADTFPGQLRQNIPSVIGMRVKKQDYSRMMIEQSGCETLLGNGDCYVLMTGWQSPVRVQAAYADESEMESIVDEIKQRWAA